MHRFFIPPTWIGGEQATLEGPVARQIAVVLRLAPGQGIILLDNSGREYKARLLEVAPHRVVAHIEGVDWGKGEPGVHLTLYQALLKGEKFPWVLQKGTEIGVSAFVPLLTQRSVPRWHAQQEKERLARWRRILQEAAEQAGRPRLPEVVAPLPFRQACSQARGLALLPWEGEAYRDLHQALQEGQKRIGEPPTIALFIGPEGGWTEDEVAYARDRGILPITLGRRILRAETAAIVASALVLFALGEMGTQPPRENAKPAERA